MRYVLHPGRVANDSGVRFVGERALCRLYGVAARDCVCADAFGYKELPGDVHLYPRYDGKYARIPARDAG